MNHSEERICFQIQRSFKILRPTTATAASPETIKFLFIFARITFSLHFAVAVVIAVAGVVGAAVDRLSRRTVGTILLLLLMPKNVSKP